MHSTFFRINTTIRRVNRRHATSAPVKHVNTKCHISDVIRTKIAWLDFYRICFTLPLLSSVSSNPATVENISVMPFTVPNTSSGKVSPINTQLPLNTFCKGLYTWKGNRHTWTHSAPPQPKWLGNWEQWIRTPTTNVGIYKDGERISNQSWIDNGAPSQQCFGWIFGTFVNCIHHNANQWWWYRHQDWHDENKQIHLPIQIGSMRWWWGVGGVIFGLIENIIILKVKKGVTVMGLVNLRSARSRCRLAMIL